MTDNRRRDMQPYDEGSNRSATRPSVSQDVCAQTTNIMLGLNKYRTELLGYLNEVERLIDAMAPAVREVTALAAEFTPAENVHANNVREIAKKIRREGETNLDDQEAAP